MIVKRTKKPIFGTESSAIHTLINELRIRSHPPLRGHPNIVDLKGTAWDFENSDEGEPIHLLVEEFAPHRALDTFWGVRDLVRMPLLVKANLCRDVAEDINALHDCGIAHGDIKPGNVLIFPNSKSTMGDKGRRFTAKLTDFGHSVCEFTKDPTLPIWTPTWSAPEANPDVPEGVCAQIQSFEDITATDVYSYGLVAVSIILGTAVVGGKFPELADTAAVSVMKLDDSMLDHIMEVVIREDRTHPDSDFDLGFIRVLLRRCLRKQPSERSMLSCIEILKGYVAIHRVEFFVFAF